MENEYNESFLQPTQDERTLAMLAHVLGLFGSFLAPLIIYLVKKDESIYIREHAKEALNFQISICIYLIISFIFLLIIVGILGFLFVGIFSFVLTIVAAIKALDGKMYRYPFCIRIL